LNVFEIEKLNLSIDGKKIFENANFSIEQGKYYAIISGNGTGKSSFFNVILGKKIAKSLLNYDLFDSEHTRILNNNQSISGLFNERIAYLSDQEPFFLNETVYKELFYSFEVDEKKRFRDDIIDSFLTATKLQKIKHRKLRKCSSGERKLIYLMQVLIIARKKRLLLLDEPLNHLDASKIMIVSDLINALRTSNRELSIIVITHVPWLNGIEKAFSITNYHFVETQYLDFTKLSRDLYNPDQKVLFQALFGRET
jgi:ABC-type multidrug transport system ATPase subunit